MGAIIDVSDATFDHDVIAQSVTAPVVVDFWAAWCGPCRSLGPTLEEVARGAEGVTLAKLDVDANPRSQQRFGIRGIPAVKAFRDGRVVDEFVGNQPRRSMEQFFGRLATPVIEELPADEAGLRALIERAPERSDARRELGRRLMRSGQQEEAAEVLAPGAHDPAVDGLLARTELLRDTPAALPGSLAVPDGATEMTVVPDV
ncbi:MAG: thioredoxin family protein, partial [Candidatus Dormibacteria bacterium]